MPSPRPPDNTNAFSRLRNKTLDKVIGVDLLTPPQSSRDPQREDTLGAMGNLCQL